MARPIQRKSQETTGLHMGIPPTTESKYIMSRLFWRSTRLLAEGQSVLSTVLILASTGDASTT